jgi:hypothetical protein
VTSIGTPKIEHLDLDDLLFADGFFFRFDADDGPGQGARLGIVARLQADFDFFAARLIQNLAMRSTSSDSKRKSKTS